MGNFMEIFKKHSALISSSHRHITVTQKKALNVFYKNAKEALEAGQEMGKWHKVDVEVVRDLLGIKKGNTKHLKDELWKMTKIDVQYDIFHKDRKMGWGRFGLLQNDIKIEYDENGKGFFEYKLAEKIEENLVMPNIFAKIDLSVIKMLKSKYAVILYELLEDYKNVNVPKMTLDELRELMGVEENQYALTANLKKKVIEVAKNEINEKTHFTVDYELIKSGRKIVGIQWRIIELDESKQNKYFEKMEFITKVRNTYKQGEILYDMSAENGTKLIMGKNGMLAKKYDWKDKAETVKKDLANDAWNWLFNHQELMEKPRNLFRI